MTGRILRRLAAALAAFALIGAAAASAEIKTKAIEYQDGDTMLTGHLAWDDAISGKRPGVLVVHEWWGLNDYAKSRARQLAEQGYVAFALDMYGDDKVTEHPDEAGAWSSQVSANIDAWVTRANAGLEILKSQEQVDAERTAAIGYCFGGSTVMQMAYAGADVDAVVSFHGALPAAPSGVTSVAPRILAAHGADDAFVPGHKVEAFKQGLDRIGASYEFQAYPGARHAFTNPGAARYGIENIAYNEAADQKSWAAMMRLFGEALR